MWKSLGLRCRDQDSRGGVAEMFWRERKQVFVLSLFVLEVFPLNDYLLFCTLGIKVKFWKREGYFSILEGGSWAHELSDEKIGTELLRADKLQSFQHLFGTECFWFHFWALVSPILGPIVVSYLQTQHLGYWGYWVGTVVPKIYLTHIFLAAEAILNSARELPYNSVLYNRRSSIALPFPALSSLGRVRVHHSANFSFSVMQSSSLLHLPLKTSCQFILVCYSLLWELENWVLAHRKPAARCTAEP